VEGRAVIGEREFESAGAHRVQGFQQLSSKISRVASFAGKVKARRFQRFVTFRNICSRRGGTSLRGKYASNRE
jgi:hypothetical protein